MKLDRTLGVTSPMMHGKDVEHAQHMLHGDAESKFADYRPGVVDGKYGTATGAAAKRAKYWLGYKASEIRGSYGQTLENFLSGKTPLTSAMKTRRANRLKQAAQVPLREKAFKQAVSQIGTKESPANSNRCKYSYWYGIIGPWCAMFTTWCYVGAGSKLTFRRGVRYSYVPNMVLAARGHDYRMVRISKDEVKRGDIVTFDWEGGGMGGSPYSSDHVGLFDEWINKGAGTFKTVEGNTAVGNNSNGGQVMRRERSMSEVSCFMRADA